MIPQERANFPQAPEKREHTKKQKIIALISGGALALTIGGGLFANHVTGEKPPVMAASPSDINPAPQKASEITTSGPLRTLEKQDTVEANPTIENLEIDASSFSNPEALIKIFTDERTTEWFNAGATLENAKAALASGKIDNYAKEVAAKYDKMFIDALLIKDWESNVFLKAWVDNMIEIHSSTLSLYFYTSFPKIDPDDKEPYRRSTEYTEFRSGTRSNDGVITISTAERNSDNADRNRVGEKLTGGKKVTGESGYPTRTFVVEGGKVKLSNMILYNK